MADSKEKEMREFLDKLIKKELDKPKQFVIYSEGVTIHENILHPFKSASLNEFATKIRTETKN